MDDRAAPPRRRTYVEPLAPEAAQVAAAAARANEPVTLRGFLSGVERALKSIPSAWVKAEILRLDARERYTSIEVVEHDGLGKVVAQARGVIHAAKWRSIAHAFEAAGLPLRAGVRVMVHATPRFSSQYGFSLEITDVDPSYTAGDLALKAEAIRARLRAEGLWDRNRALPPPPDFLRIAVVSPARAAGLADFESSATPLQRAGLVRFEFFEAIFQRHDAPEQICAALRKIYADCKAGRFCAVAIVRDGGAAADLAYLCDYNLTRAVALMPVPVMIGIGHEVDRTLLDEVACLSFSTPSKVIAHIRSTVCGAAEAGARAIATIHAEAGAVLLRLENGVLAAGGAICERAARQVEAAAAGVRRVRDTLRPDARAALDAATRRVAEAERGVALAAQARREAAREAVAGLRRDVVERVMSGLSPVERGLAVAAHAAETVPAALAAEAARSVEATIQAVRVAAGQCIGEAEAGVRLASTTAEALDPRRLLASGYSILRDPARDGAPVTSATALRALPSVVAELADGVAVLSPTPQESCR